MNIAGITQRFALLAGMDAQDAEKWTPLIDDAVSFISASVIKPEISADDAVRLEALCAVYAFKLFRLSSDDRVSSFSVGDVSVTPSAAVDADRLWTEYAEKSQDLICGEKFLFGRVV